LQLPTAQEILERVKNLNPDLDESSVEVILIGPNFATISPLTSGKYYVNPKVDVHFNLGLGEQRRKLSELFSDTNLGHVGREDFSSEADSPRLQEIIKKKTGVNLDFKQLD